MNVSSLMNPIVKDINIYIYTYNPNPNILNVDAVLLDDFIVSGQKV